MKLYVEMTEEEYEKYKVLLKKEDNKEQEKKSIIENMDIGEFLHDKGFIIENNEQYFDAMKRATVMLVCYEKEDIRVTVRMEKRGKI